MTDLVTPTEADLQLVKGYARLEADDGLTGRVADDFASKLDDEALRPLFLDYCSKAAFYVLAMAGLMREVDRRIALGRAENAAAEGDEP